MQGKTILITGSNSGIGKETSLALAKKGARILMHARNKDKGNEARNYVIENSGNNDIDLFICDLADLNEVREMAEQIDLKYPQIDVLINNAGLMAKKRRETKQGFEYTFGVNHLSHFLLTNLLIDKLKKSESGRIINVSSVAHTVGNIYFDDINLTKKFSGFGAYAQSKLANILFTYSLCHKLESYGITANAVHPGTVASKFAHSRDPKKSNFIMKLGRIVMLSTKKGAEPLIYLASSEKLEGQSGLYYDRMKSKSSSKRSYDLDYAKKLWDLSLEMTGLKEPLI